MPFLHFSGCLEDQKPEHRCGEGDGCLSKTRQTGWMQQQCLRGLEEGWRAWDGKVREEGFSFKLIRILRSPVSYLLYFYLHNVFTIFFIIYHAYYILHNIYISNNHSLHVVYNLSIIFVSFYFYFILFLFFFFPVWFYLP